MPTDNGYGDGYFNEAGEGPAPHAGEGSAQEDARQAQQAGQLGGPEQHGVPVASQDVAYAPAPAEPWGAKRDVPPIETMAASTPEVQQPQTVVEQAPQQAQTRAQRAADRREAYWSANAGQQNVASVASQQAAVSNTQQQPGTVASAQQHGAAASQQPVAATAAQQPGAESASPQSGVATGIPQQGAAPYAQQGAAPYAQQGAAVYGQPGAAPYAPFSPYAAGSAAPVAPVAQPAAQKKSRGWIVAVVLIVCLFAFTAFCVNACSNAMSDLGGLGYSGGYATDKLSGDGVAVIDLAGTIQYDGTACSPEGLKTLLDVAEDNAHVKAVVLRVDSGGGTATAGEEMAIYVRDFKKPIVVSSASINASAAYEISSQADYIYVAQSTEIGAIGTAMQLTDLSGLLDKLGVNMDTITSAEEKDSSYGFRPLTDEEREYYQGMVDEINEVFVQNVAAGRKMAVEDVRKLATGMPFTGTAAVKNGLADAIGTREDAVDKAAELAGVSGSYETVDLYFPSYDIAGLSTLLGSNEQSLAGLLGELESGKAEPRMR